MSEGWHIFEELNIAWISRDGDMHYDSTPIGAFIFANSGIDGVSYCLMPRKDDVTLENSPVYTLSPMDFSEGTVVWSAKNLNDFLMLTLLCESALYASSIYTMSNDEFIDFLEVRKFEIGEWDKSSKERLTKATKAIKSILPKSANKYDYNYFMNCYKNKENHLDLCFKSEVEMRSYQLGYYCHDD